MRSAGRKGTAPQRNHELHVAGSGCVVGHPLYYKAWQDETPDEFLLGADSPEITDAGTKPHQMSRAPPVDGT